MISLFLDDSKVPAKSEYVNKVPALEELVSADHFSRHLERTLDLAFVREFVEQTYAGKGHPSIEPIVFFKLQFAAVRDHFGVVTKHVRFDP